MPFLSFEFSLSFPHFLLFAALHSRLHLLSLLRVMLSDHPGSLEKDCDDTFSLFYLLVVELVSFP
jgi:hypothetical protein